MKTFWLAAAAATALASAAAAAQQAPTPAGQSVQQQFDAAGDAYENNRFAEALAILETLERRLADTPRSLAIVRVRKGQALHRLNRLREAETTLRAALPLLPPADASLNEDRFLGYVSLARVSELRLDYREAAAQYRTAHGIEVPPAIRLSVYRGLVQTQMFHDAPAALAAADEALRIAAVTNPADGEIEGTLRTLRGRVLLNMGRIPEAREELERATRSLGGLGRRVNLRDITARSDLAIAALLGRDPEAARRYLALTGAGRMERSMLPLTGRMPLPRCGNGLAPGDVTVLELAIREDGAVVGTTPVYASAQGDAAVRMARAALDWAWLPEELAGMDPLFRAGVRVEVRCSNSVWAGDEALAPAREAAARWSAATSVPLEVRPARNQTLPQMRAELAAAEARHGASSPHLLRPLSRLAARDDLSGRDRERFLERALGIAIAARAPGPYVAGLALSLAEEKGGTPDYAALMRVPGLLDDPDTAAEFYAGASDRLYAAGRERDAAAMLARLEAVPGLAPDHMGRIDLVGRRAALAAAGGNPAPAAAFPIGSPTAHSACQVPPRRRSGTGGEGDFPNDAMRWGFEGFVAVEAQVGTPGRPEQIRTVIAYPPFVFGEAAERIVERFRFDPAAAPGGVACATMNQRVVFRLPDRPR
ncbi:MAG TPA: TonB family protein [Allosphingosinicella sp.]|nr:TonB family protein [Allosphingosinicella sp.]